MIFTREKQRGQVADQDLLQVKEEESGPIEPSDPLLAYDSVISLLDLLIGDAYQSRVSDIHLDPTGESFRIRYRVDGLLSVRIEYPKELQDEIISRIKVCAGLRTDEHQAPQDGRFRVFLPEGNEIDVRVSIAPTYHGENAVLRLLTEHESDVSLEYLGFSPEQRKIVEKALARNSGMILSTGPTGSGKTTTLYTLIQRLNTSERSIVTIEDPIEYAISGIEQIQVNPRTHLTFASGLRAIVRQDPDIIMVGEIRDRETASIGVNTALAGHLLLSTLHTNDAATTLPRLIDMGVEPFLVASTVSVVIGQRLIRKLCPACKTRKTLSAAEFERLSAAIPGFSGMNQREWHTHVGCESCHHTGFKGRIAILEVMPMTNVLRDAVLKKESAAAIKARATGEGMKTMLEDGVLKASKGLTTLEEVLRMSHE